MRLFSPRLQRSAVMWPTSTANFLLCPLNASHDRSIAIEPKHFCSHHMSITGIPAPSRQPLQDHSTALFLSRFLELIDVVHFIHAGNHGAVLPISPQESAGVFFLLLLNLRNCKYTGSVAFCWAFFYVFGGEKKHVIYRKRIVVKLVLRNLYNCLCFD